MFSPALYLSQLGMASLSGFLAVVLVLETAPASKGDWRFAARLLAAISCASCLHGLYGWWLGVDPFVRSTFTNPDCYSVIPLLGFFLNLGLALEGRSLVKALHFLAGLIALVALLLTASRAGALAVALGYFAFLIPFAISRSEAHRQTSLKLFVVPSVVVLLVVFFGSDLPLVSRISKLSDRKDSFSVVSRVDVLTHCYQTIARAPLFGSGLGCFHLAYQQDRTILSAGENYMNVAHNDYVQWTVETGLLGGGLWVGLLVASVLFAWTSYSAPISWVASQIGATVGIGVYCFLNFACPVPADLLWVGAVLGLSGSLVGPKVGQSVPGRRQPRTFPFFALLFALGVWTVSFASTGVQVQKRLVEVAQSRSLLDWERAYASLEAAARLQPQNFLLSREMSEVAKKAFLFSGEKNWLTRQERALAAGRSVSPKDLPLLLASVYFFQSLNQPSEAQKFLDQAKQLAAYSPALYQAESRNKLLQGNLLLAADALKSIEKTGIPADDVGLAKLLYVIEVRYPGKGCALLSKIAAEDVGRGVTLGQAAAQAAADEASYPVAARLLKQIGYFAPDRVEALFALSNVRGKLGDSKGELKILERLKNHDKVMMDDVLCEQVWQRWAQLHLDRGHSDAVVTQLEEYLITHQRQIWPRLLISQVYLQRDQKAEGRSALREGLPFDRDGSLRIRLADLCQSQGLRELARSYYREALKFPAQKSLATARLKELAASPKDPDGLEDPNLVEENDADKLF